MAEKKVYTLANSELSVEIIPIEGGRISSLRSVHSNLEFLTQSERSGPYPEPGLTTRFRDGACAGIEECLPTVASCGPETDGGTAPDHGDFWQLPWHVVKDSKTELSMTVLGFSRTLRFDKRLNLEGDTLRASYKVENLGPTLQSFLYACHPLFAVSAGDRILLPGEIQELTLDYSRGGRLGAAGSTVSWPIAQSGHRLDVVSGSEAGTAEMFYSSRLNETVCGIYRMASHEVLEVSFDRARLPYLGLWLCYGGWPDDSIGPLQYAVALEPTTSPHNTLAKAQQARAAIVLEVGKVFDWEISFSVRESGRSHMSIG
jgi:galactose mutarotase-like enzyme